MSNFDFEKEKVVILKAENPLLRFASFDPLENPTSDSTGFYAVKAVANYQHGDYDIGDAIGYAGILLTYEWTSPDIPIIGNLVVLPKWQDSGLAYSLVSRNVQLCIDAEFEHFTAYANAPDAEVYESLGFEPQGTVVDKTGNQKLLFAYDHSQHLPGEVE